VSGQRKLIFVVRCSSGLAPLILYLWGPARVWVIAFNRNG